MKALDERGKMMTLNRENAKAYKQHTNPHYFCVIWSDFFQTRPQAEMQWEKGKVREISLGEEGRDGKKKPRSSCSELAGFNAVSHRSTLRRGAVSPG